MRFTFLLIAAVIAIVVGVIALKFSAKEPPPAPVVAPVVQDIAPRSETLKTSDVLLAKVDIPVGTKINETMVDVQPWPAHLVLDNFIVSGNEEVVGRITRAAIQAHEPFLKSKLANENDPGFLAGALPSGMRAITVATDVVSGVAGFVFPGDRVDIVFAHNVPAEIDETQKGGATRPALTEVLVPNARVLAVNVRDNNVANNGPATPNNVTLEVSDEDAQRVRLAEKIGTLSLSLRSIKDDNTSIPNPTRMVDLSHIGIFKTTGVTGESGVLVVRGPGSGGGQITTSKTVGGVTVNGDQPAVGGGVFITAPARSGSVKSDYNNH